MYSHVYSKQFGKKKKKKVLEGLKGKYISEIKMKCIIIYLFLTEP